MLEMTPTNTLSKGEVLDVLPSLRDRLLALDGPVAKYVQQVLRGEEPAPLLAQQAADEAAEMEGQLHLFERMVARARRTDFTGVEQRDLGLDVPG
jgi:hypothetical protein